MHHIWNNILILAKKCLNNVNLHIIMNVIWYGKADSMIISHVWITEVSFIRSFLAMGDEDDKNVVDTSTDPTFEIQGEA